MKIGLFTSVYFNNIGNGFIDLGCEAQLDAIASQVRSHDPIEIIKVSQCANFAASVGKAFLLKENRFFNWFWVRFMQKFANQFHDKSYSTVSTLDVISPAKIAKFDYLILPGCILTVPFFTIYGKLLEEKVQQVCKLIFWAVSGNHYTEEEISVVSTWLKKLKPFAICTRDSVAYKHYRDMASKVYNGIDNVFFVNRLGLNRCETTMDPYLVFNIEEPKHHSIKKHLEEEFSNRNIIYTDHKPTPYSKIMRLSKQNIVCSDYPLDYLFLYRNVDTTYSDRVHACIPTLSFGNKAQLLSDSPRIALFENVGIDLDAIKNHPVSLDQAHLKDLQDKQIAFLNSLLS